MTFRQAIYKASIELGFTEEEIKRRGARSDAIMNNITGPSCVAALDKELELKPGVTEEQFIQGIKPMLKKILDLPEEAKVALVVGGIHKFEKKTTLN